MKQEFKIIIAVIVTVWLFAMGMIIGQYSHRNSAEKTAAALSNTAATTSEQPGQSAGDRSPTVYVTNEQGAVYVDENGQPLTQIMLPSPSKGTVFVTDENGAVYVDSNGVPLTSTVETAATQGLTGSIQIIDSNEKPSGSENEATQQTTANEPTTQKRRGEDEIVDARFTADAIAIKNDHFYVKGREYLASDDSTAIMKFATDGSNVELFTELEGLEIGMMFQDDEMIIIFDGGYLKVSNTIMNMVGIEKEDYNFDSSFLTTLFDDSVEATVESVKDGDRTVTRTEYDCARGHIRAYSAGDTLIRIEVCPLGTESATEIYYFDSVSADIPHGLLTTDGLKKKNIVSFFTELIKQAGDKLGVDETDLSQLADLE